VSAPDPVIDEGGVAVDGRVVLFGYPDSPARVRVVPRPRRWRVVGAARRGLATILIAPLVGIVPPHAPWILGVLGVGTLLTRRRLQEVFTLVAADSACPRCGHHVAVRRGRLRAPHPVQCDGCHHESVLQLDPVALDHIRLDT